MAGLSKRKATAPLRKRISEKESLKKDIEKRYYRERRLWIALLSASLLCNLLIAASPAPADRSESHRLQHLLQHLLYYMQTIYIEPVEEERLLEGAAKGLLEAAEDPYTRYMSKEEFGKFLNMEEGRQVGVGLEVDTTKELPRVIAPVPKGPADVAGVLPGDRILAIDDKSAEGLSAEELSLLMSGDSNTSLQLTLKREGVPKPLTLSITRNPFRLDYVRSHFFARQKIGYIQLLRFLGERSGSIEEFYQALNSFRIRNAKGLIIDLRNNPGGHLSMAVALVSCFLKPGQLIAHVKGKEEKDQQRVVAKRQGRPVSEELPLVLLINGASASASEIMAGALRDHGRARLIGSRSYGKASVQSIIRDLPGGSAALLTTRRYYTPAGHAIHDQGLDPDIEVEDLEISIIDHYFVNQLHEEGFFSHFQERYPRFSEQLVEPFLKSISNSGWEPSSQISLLVLKKEYRLYHPYEADPSIDPPLRQALQELNGLP